MIMRSRGSKAFPRWLRPALLALGVALLFFLGRVLHLEDRLRELHHWLRSLGPAGGPAVFSLFFAGGTLFAIPGSAMTLIAGLFFKPLTAVGVSTLGSTLGGGAAFLIARNLAREDLARWASRSQRFRKLDRMTEKHGAWIVAMLRLMPLSPFSVLNYAFGLTRVRFWEYLLWSCLCTLPNTLFFVLGARVIMRTLRERQMPWTLVGLLAGVTLLLALGMAFVERRLEKKA